MKRTYLIDVGDFARRDLEHYRSLARDLRDQGLEPPDLSAARGRDDVLRACDAHYLTEGLGSWAEIESGSVDLVFSQVVLEHIPHGDFDDVLAESHRVLRPGGLALHSVDLHDHLGGGLESLRFSHDLREGDLMRESGFYTNRLRFADIVDRCAATGFEIKVTRLSTWPRLPIPHRHLAPAFAALPDRDLAVCAFDLALRKRRAGTPHSSISPSRSRQSGARAL